MAAMIIGRSAAWTNVGRSIVLVAGCLLYVAVLAPVPVHAQQRPTRVWLGLGLGGTASTTSDADATAVMGQLVYQRAPHHVALRGLVSADLYGSSDALGEIGVIYGRVFAGNLGHAMVGTGLALTDHDRCNDDRDGCSAIGIPVVAEAGFSPLTLLGIGLQAFVNLNRASTYGGLVVMLQLGWMP